ncbi:speckle-type POZ protein [Trichonephila clavata]|uniref:Speckle-type POZ protein n=1 Tax=Trichonephila clavata TaxID=2740835 RepID=A0A8X6KXN9_TRICU|nr:speckle-type POZ protein [Trichonephila clavata]
MAMVNGYFHSTYYSEPTRFLYTWTIPNFSKLRQDIGGEDLLLPNGKDCSFSLRRDLGDLRLSMKTTCTLLTCSVTIFTCNGAALIRKKFMKTNEVKGGFSYYHLHLTLHDFNDLKDLPENVLFIVFGIHDPELMYKNFSTLQNGPKNEYLNYFRNLAADIKNAPDSLWKEKVTLRVGNDTEVVNKAVLCSRSPVFARMLESDMENCVTIDDVTIEGIRDFVYFLHSGIVLDKGIDSLHNLYYIANKYDVAELFQESRNLLVSKFHPENVCKTLKLSRMFNDDYLNFSAMLFIQSNLRLVVNTEGWIDLMINEPKTAMKIIDFFFLDMKTRLDL